VREASRAPEAPCTNRRVPRCHQPSGSRPKLVGAAYQPNGFRTRSESICRLCALASFSNDSGSSSCPAVGSVGCGLPELAVRQATKAPMRTRASSQSCRCDPTTTINLPPELFLLSMYFARRASLWRCVVPGLSTPSTLYHRWATSRRVMWCIRAKKIAWADRAGAPLVSVKIHGKARTRRSPLYTSFCTCRNVPAGRSES